MTVQEVITALREELTRLGVDDAPFHIDSDCRFIAIQRDYIRCDHWSSSAERGVYIEC